MKFYKQGLLATVILCGLVILQSGVIAAAAPDFASAGFKQLWEYSDRYLTFSLQPGRGYTWGPVTGGTFQEPYAESPNGLRTVQYFDKSRMELTRDNKLVTNGLLTKELVSGKRQVGDNKFIQLAASILQVAGDSNLGGGNSNAPVYASFEDLATFAPGQNAAPQRTGQPVDQGVNKAGQVSKLSKLPVSLAYAYFEPVTAHNVPQVFWDYQKLTGQVWDGNAYLQKKVFTDNPTVNVFGYPISEAYWTRTVVAGQERDVLVQLFERRVLTYTPSNSDPYKVEMGNIGQHYLQWRTTGSHLIVIDSGHGGTDSGAVHKDSSGKIDLMEKTVTLAIGLKAAELLRAQGYQVVLTRSTDASPNTPPKDLNGDGTLDIADDLQSRINIANYSQAELFLSIHINSSIPGSKNSGIETWYCADRPFSEDNKRLAALVQQESLAGLKEVLGYSAANRGIIDDLEASDDNTHFYVLGPATTKKKFAAAMPGIISEILFLSNDAEAVILADPRLVTAQAQSYVRAINAYLQPAKPPV